MQSFYNCCYALSKKVAKLASSLYKQNNYDIPAKAYFFTRSQIRVKDWAYLTTKEQRQEAIETLIKMGHISEQIEGRYYLNPTYLTD